MTSPYADLPRQDPPDGDIDYIECPSCGGYTSVHWIGGVLTCDHCGAHVAPYEID